MMYFVEVVKKAQLEGTAEGELQEATSNARLQQRSSNQKNPQP